MQTIQLTFNEKEFEALNEVISDCNFWPGSVPPKSVNQVLVWLCDDLIDYYQQYKGGI